MSTTADFWVGGTPVTQGSIQVRVTRDGRPFAAPENSAALKRWRRAIAVVASTAVPRCFEHEAVALSLDFAFVRPPSVRREFPSSRSAGDLDKLCRAVLDALTGVAYRDDAQVVSLRASKSYRPDGAGVRIGVGPRLDELDWPAGEGA